MIKKISTAMLAALLLLQTTACGDKTPAGTAETTGTTAADTDTVETEPETTPLQAMGEADFGGKTFTILDANDLPNMHVNIPGEELTGDPINDALYNRDLIVSEKYNVEIDYVQEAGFITSFKNSVVAGDTAYNSIISRGLGDNMAALANQGILYNLNEISSGEDANWNKPWWSGYMYDAMQLGGKFFFTTGDYAAAVYQAPACVFFNVDLGLDYSIQASDLYAQVRELTWTYESLFSMTKGMNQDLNGDNAYRHEDDFAGILIHKDYDQLNGMMVSCGVPMSRINEEGHLVVDLLNDKTISILEMLHQLYEPMYTYDHVDNTTQIAFPERRGLFLIHKVENATAALRDMDDDFAVLPLPKYDETQEHYYSLISGWVFCMVGMPKTLEDPAFNGFVTEAIARAAYELVRPAAFETTLKGKTARDEESVAMLDLIFSTLYMDFNCMYNFGNVSSKMTDWMVAGEGFASGYAALEKPIAAAIEKVEKAYLD